MAGRYYQLYTERLSWTRRKCLQDIYQRRKNDMVRILVVEDDKTHAGI